MRMRGPTLVASALALSGCASSDSASTVVVIPGLAAAQDLDAAIYSSIVDHIARERGVSTQWYLNPSLNRVGPRAPLLQRINSVSGLRASFQARNAEPGEIDVVLDTDVSLRLLGPDQAAEPGMRVLSFTRPGVSTDQQTAVIYYKYWCGGLCGQSRLAHLELTHGSWEVVSDIVMLVH